MSAVTVGLAAGDGSEARMAEVLERELPGFWAFFKARHSRWAEFGNPDGPPVGAMPALLVHEDMAETIPAYVRHLRDMMGPIHASDCALHNEPAYPAGPCDCGA